MASISSIAAVVFRMYQKKENVSDGKIQRFGAIGVGLISMSCYTILPLMVLIVSTPYSTF